jgi:aarF domain-containing kinase
MAAFRAAPRSLALAAGAAATQRSPPVAALVAAAPRRRRRGGGRAPPPPLVVARAAGAAGAPPSAPRAPPSSSRPPPDAADAARRFAELVSELTQLAVAAGPRGPVRALQGAAALLSVAQEAFADAAARSGGAGGAPLTPPSAPALLRRLFERLGATYIKLGQFIASSPTLFPEEYVLEFQQCLDRATPVPFEEIKAVVEEELRGPLSNFFESVDATPLACASIAQVHAGVLRGSRKEVVLKVLKPGVSDALAADLSFVYAAARVLEFLAPDVARGSLAAVVGDLRASMLDELDFRKEAQNVAAFSAYLSASPAAAAAATTPFIYPALSTRRLLTQERLRGVPLTDLRAIRGAAAARGATPEAVLIGALNTWAGSVVACESFHADLHAGNLLVLPDGRVAFIDFGIVGRVSPATWGALNALLRAASGGDWRAAAAALAALGAASDSVDVDAFGDDLSRLAASLERVRASVVLSGDPSDPSSDAVTASLAVDEAELNRVLLEFVRVGDAHGVRFPREFGLLLKQVLYFDRYQRALAPGLDVMSDARVRLNVDTTARVAYG